MVRLTDLYVLVKDVAASEIGEVFDEIDEAVSRMILARMGAGLMNPSDRYPNGFDCPAHGEQALKALVEDSLTHEALLMLYRLGWDKYESSGPWLAIADLSRAQILRRMTPLPVKPQSTDWEAWSRSELARRLRLQRRDVIKRTSVTR